MVNYDGGDALLRALSGKTTLLSSVYIGLSSTAPNVDGTGFSEPATGAGYARVLIGTLTGGGFNVMGDPVENETANEQIIFFPEATGNWGTMTHFGLFTSNDLNTKPIISGALTSSVSVPTNYVALFRVGNFQLSIS